MTKKRRLLFSIIGLLTALCVFSTTALVALANNSGYVKYKEALFNTMKHDNLTANISATLEINGEVIETGNEQTKFDGKKTLFTPGPYNDEPLYFQRSVYTDEETIISFDGTGSVNYSSANGRSSPDPMRNLTDNQQKLIDIAIDTFLGDTKNYIITENNKVTFNLQEYQVPQLAQAGLAVIAETYKNQSQDEYEDELADFFRNDNVSIKNVYGDGEYTGDGFIKNFNLTIEFGATKNNTPQTLKTSFALDISDINSTVINKPAVN